MNEWMQELEPPSDPRSAARPRRTHTTVQNPHCHHLTTKNLKILFRICNRHASTIHSRSTVSDPLLRIQMEGKIRSRKHLTESLPSYGGCSTCHISMGIRCMVKRHHVTCRCSFVAAVGFWHSVAVKSRFRSRPGRANI